MFKVNNKDTKTTPMAMKAIKKTWCKKRKISSSLLVKRIIHEIPISISLSTQT